MAHAKLSSRNQIVIPRAIREALKLKAGDKLEVVVQGEMLMVFRKRKSLATAIRGRRSLG